MFVDASNIAIDNVLMQLYEPNQYHLVYSANRHLSKAKQNYSKMERESLDMIYNMTKVPSLFDGSEAYLSRSPLNIVVSGSLMTGKLVHWTLLLQELEFDIVHKSRVQHAMANNRSQLEFREALTEVTDDFPHMNNGNLRRASDNEDPEK